MGHSMGLFFPSLSFFPSFLPSVLAHEIILSFFVFVLSCYRRGLGSGRITSSCPHCRKRVSFAVIACMTCIIVEWHALSLFAFCPFLLDQVPLCDVLNFVCWWIRSNSRTNLPPSPLLLRLGLSCTFLITNARRVAQIYMADEAIHMLKLQNFPNNALYA